MAIVKFPNGYVGSVSDAVSVIMEKNKECVVIRSRPDSEEARLIAARDAEDGKKAPPKTAKPARSSADLAAALEALKRKVTEHAKTVTAAEKSVTDAYALGEDASKASETAAALRHEHKLMCRALGQIEAEHHAACAAEYAIAREALNVEAQTVFGKLSTVLREATSKNVAPILKDAGIGSGALQRFENSALDELWAACLSKAAEKIRALPPVPPTPPARDPDTGAILPPPSQFDHRSGRS